MNQTAWTELFRAKASIYALDEKTKQWLDRGTSGIFVMFLNNQFRSDVRIKWEKHGKQFWWRLINGKLKPKGERAWVLKSWATHTNSQEILAIRFSDQNMSNIFYQKYNSLFPQQGQQPQQQVQQQQPQQQQAQQPRPQQQQQGYQQANNFASSAANNNAYANNYAANNSASSSSAVVSSSSSSNAKWECAVCTYRNTASRVACEMCGLPKDASDNAAPQQSIDQMLAPSIPESPAVHNNVYNNGGNNMGRGQKQFFPNVSRNNAGGGGGNAAGGGGAGAGGAANNQFMPHKPSAYNNYGKNVYGASAQYNNRMVSNSFGQQQSMQYNGMKPPSMGGRGRGSQSMPYGQQQGQQQQQQNRGRGLNQSPLQQQQQQNNGMQRMQNNNNNLNGRWQCKICNVMNSRVAPRCEACNTSRQSSTSAYMGNAGLGMFGQWMVPSVPGNYPVQNANLMQGMQQHRSGSSQNLLPSPALQSNNSNGVLANNQMVGMNNGGGNNGMQRQQQLQQQQQQQQQALQGGQASVNNAMMGNGNVNAGGGGGAGVNAAMMNNMNMSMAMAMSSGGNDMRRQQIRSAEPQQMEQMARTVAKEMQSLNNKKSFNAAKYAATEQEFQHASSYIASYNDDPYAIFKTLKSVATKLMKDDMRYRTLDTTNPKVMERLIGFEGVLEFLMLLGFESDAIGMKLVCEQKPGPQTIENACHVLNSYVHRLGLGRITKKVKNKLLSMSSDDDHKETDRDSDLESYVTIGGPMDNLEDEDDEDTLTLEQIIIWATHESVRDFESMETLLLTHKTFTDSVTLIKQLRKRFFVPVPLNIRTDPQKARQFRLTVQKSIQLKVIKSLRDWLKNFWDEDFATDSAVQNELRFWLQEMKKHAIETNYMDKLARTVLNEFERYLQTGSPKIKQPVKEYATVPVKVKKKKLQIGNLGAEDLADQITLMDFDRFERIEARECLGQAWKKKNNKVLAANILGMIQQFNNLTLFVQIQILREKNLNFRAKAIKRVIKMGQRFEEMKNYNSLCAIFSALNSAPIHRLKHAWQRVKKEHAQLFDHFRDVFSREYNHRQLRTILRNASPPAIPHIGLFLQDLVFIDDGNSKMISIDNFEELSGGKHSSMINFNKCVRCADRIKTIKLYQSHPYQLKENMNVQSLLMQEFAKLQEITEDEIWDMSSEIKAADEREFKKPGIFN